MKKVKKIEILPEMKKIENINLIKVVDYSTFQDIRNEDYYQLDNKYGSKIYREIGLKSYGYMRVLNQIDSQVSNKLIIDRIKGTRYEIFRNSENRLMIMSKEFKKRVETIEIKLNLLSDKLPEIYELRKSNNSSSISYLMINEERGYLTEIDLVEEKIEIYLVEVVGRDYFIIDKYSENELTELTGEIFLSGYYRDIGSRYYSIEEIEIIERRLKIDNILERDREKIERLNEYRKKIEFSEYSVKDLYRWIMKNLDRIETKISGYFIEVEEERLAWDRMKD